MYRIVTFDKCSICGILYVLLWIANGVSSTSVNKHNQINQMTSRSWTGWYNTDRPTAGNADDERVNSMRKRGYQVCNGNSPIDAICRDASDHALVFTSQTVKITDDKLVVSCTTRGLLCRNIDQINGTCRDYEIQFECLDSLDDPLPPNLGVIGVAAGLSVIVPIICVAIMHIARLCRDRRRPSLDNLITENSEQSVQTDMPPSYSFLFPDTASIHSETDNSGPASRVATDAGQATSPPGSGGPTGVTVSLVAPVVVSSSGDSNSNIPNNSFSSGSLPSLSEFSPAEAASEPLRPGVIDSSTQQTQQCRTPTTSRWRDRFPNMHLSVFDLFMTSDCSTRSPPSPDLSYIQTPPPTYKEAVIILEYDSKIKQNDTFSDIKSNNL